MLVKFERLRGRPSMMDNDGPVLRFVVESEIDDSNISIYQTVASIKPLAAE